MYRFILGPDVKVDESVKVPFVCSLSKLLRATTKDDPIARQKLLDIAGKLAQNIDSDHILHEAIRYDPKATPGDRVLRQVDLKDANFEIVMKAFVMWNKELDLWHIFIEYPSEQVWEEGVGNI